MVIKIVVDSACDLPEETAHRYGISVIPMYINQGLQGFRDGIDLTRAEFYERLPGYHPAPGTAAPGLEAFNQLYRQLAGQGADQILSIHLSEKLSSVVNVARQAAHLGQPAPVTVFDSGQLSLGAGFLAISAAQAAAQGASMAELLTLLEEQGRRTYTYAALDTLEYLRRSGRMNGVVSAIGTLLGIKPLLRMHAGQVMSEKLRTRQNAEARLVEITRQLAPFDQVALVHTHAAERAEAFLHALQNWLPEGEILRVELSPVLGAHIGLGVVGLVAITRPAKARS